MAGKPELVIPLRMDMAEAIRQVSQLTANLDRLHKETKEGMEESHKSTRGFGSALADIATHQGYQIVKDFAASMAASFKESFDYVRGLSEEFVKTQQGMQQVAALMGKSNSDKFTVEQAQQAGQANLSVDEWVKFQEQFQSFGGAYLEKVKGGPEAALKYQQGIAEYAKSRGMPPALAAELGGSILQFSDGPITPEQGFEKFGKMFTALERARTPVEKLLPQMPAVMAAGSSGLQASELLNIAAEFAPGEEGTYVANTLKGLRETRLKGKGDELGLKEGQSAVEQIKAAAMKIDERVRGGENEEAILKEYFGDIREFKGMQGFLNRGLRAGRFGEVEDMMAKTSPIKIQSELGKWEQSDTGQQAAAISQESVQRTIRGAEVSKLALESQKAKNELIGEGRFEETTWGDTARNLFGLQAFGYGSKQEQLIGARARRNMLAQAGASEKDIPSDDFIAAGPASSINAANLELLREMNATSKRIAESNEKMEAREAAPRPLVSPAPRVARAPGG